MNLFEEAIAKLGIPGSIAVVILIIFAGLQLIGEFVEACGKAAPAVMIIRKVLRKRSLEKKEKQQEITNALNDVKALLAEVNAHYSQDNITQRDNWIAWVNSKALEYDAKVVEYDGKVQELIELKDSIRAIATALEANTKTTDEIFKESCRNTIINFASKVIDPRNLVSHEEFRRVFKVYKAYEAFLQVRHEPNGEVETNYKLIKESYKERVREKNFTEDIKQLPQTQVDIS